MKGWNYRVIKRTITSCAGYVEDTYQIHSVYYNDDMAPVKWSTEPSELYGIDSLESLKTNLELMGRALEKPVLVEEEREDGTVVLKEI